MIAGLEVPLTNFDIPFEVVVIGVITGLTYALLGIGLLLVYRTSRVINFAHGEMGAVAASVMVYVSVIHELPYLLGFLAAIATALVAGVFMELVMRRLARASRLIALVATIGAAQVFFTCNLFILNARDIGSKRFPTPFDASFQLGSLRLHSPQLMMLVLVPVLTIALAAFFGRTRLGLASRAVAENEDAAELCGVSARMVSLSVWVLAGLLAAASAILISPTRPVVVQSALGPALMVRALAAAVLGGFSNPVRVFVGGVGIGVVEALVAWNYPTGGTVDLVLFIVLAGALLARRGLTLMARGGEASTWTFTGMLRPIAPHFAADVRVRVARVVGMLLLLAVGVLFVVPLSGSQTVKATTMIVFAMMGLSLVVLTGFAGQLSLGQFAFVALGAFTGGRIGQLGYDPWVAIVYAAAAGGIAALIVGLPALRIRGLFLAVTTLGFAVASTTWLRGQSWLVQTRGGSTSLQIPRLEWLGIDFGDEKNYYWLCLAVFVVLAALVHHLRGTGLGRAMMAVRDNEPNAAALSVSPRRTKLLAFVLAGILASLAGYFYGGLLGIFSEPQTFAAELSLAIVAMVILGGVTTITGTIAGAVFVKGGALLIDPLVKSLVSTSGTLIVSGAGLLITILQFPGGMAEVLFRARDRIAAWLAPSAQPPPRLVREAPTLTHLAPRELEEHEPGVPAIEASHVTVRFGGNIAVDEVSVAVAPGEIVGIVGPNGAGKTTLFDVLSGHLRPDSGQVLLKGEDITELRPEQRARRGLGRTFQQGRLFDGMTVLECLEVALERVAPTESLPAVLALPPSWDLERRKDLRSRELVDLLGLGNVAASYISELSTGTRRIVELGCAVALGADVILLDEPTAGIAQREVETFRPVIAEMRDHLGATVVIIEHDIPMIMRLVDRMYVLVSGQVIADGPPTMLREDPRVIEAYLGTDERVIQKSGEVVLGAGA
jgi:ABC-type branched-subunit amino acid transport system ATPase component/ABC-type branched-subunit amino acid transport system permease subunit